MPKQDTFVIPKDVGGTTKHHYYWDLHLIDTLTFTKIVIFYVKNGLKFDFGPVSTNES